MKKNISPSFEYEGLGFPITLLNVPIKEVRDVEVPDIDFNLLQKNVLLALCREFLPLTGNEIRFIRQFLRLNYTEFAKKIGVTHATIIHWEQSKNKFAKIQPQTELYIRLYVLDYLETKDKLFREVFRNFNFSKFNSNKSHSANEHLILDLKCNQ